MLSVKNKWVNITHLETYMPKIARAVVACRQSE